MHNLPRTSGWFDVWAITNVCNAFPYTWVPQYFGMHSHTLGYPGIWECNPTWGCIPIDWGTPVYGKALSNAGRTAWSSHTNLEPTPGIPEHHQLQAHTRELAPGSS